jgi:hypothetical protein
VLAQLAGELLVYSDHGRNWNWARISKEAAAHAKSALHVCIWGYAHARNGRLGRSSGQCGTAAVGPQQLQHIHAPQSIDEELAHLTKDLELTPKQVQVRPLLDEHHDRIQALLDKNPTASRQELEAQIHAISTMKRTTRFMLCLLITRRNWKRRCSNASIVVKKTGDLLRLRQHRPSHLLRTLDISGSLSNGSAL